MKKSPTVLPSEGVMVGLTFLIPVVTYVCESPGDEGRGAFHSCLHVSGNNAHTNELGGSAGRDSGEGAKGASLANTVPIGGWAEIVLLNYRKCPNAFF